MKIIATRKNYQPTWVFADVLEELWKHNKSFYIASWSGGPKAAWYAYDIPDVKTAFCTADTYIETIDGELTVSFENGRHRTRWLLNLGMKLIPIGLEDKHYQKAISIGLAKSRVQLNEEI
jgi:hypothetical protein